jgi:hypothetical protein
MTKKDILTAALTADPTLTGREGGRIADCDPSYVYQIKQEMGLLPIRRAIKYGRQRTTVYLSPENVDFMRANRGSLTLSEFADGCITDARMDVEEDQ